MSATTTATTMATSSPLSASAGSSVAVRSRGSRRRPLMHFLVPLLAAATHALGT